MKKRITSLLVLIALICSMSIVVNAYYSTTSYCDHCKKITVWQVTEDEEIKGEEKFCAHCNCMRLFDVYYYIYDGKCTNCGTHTRTETPIRDGIYLKAICRTCSNLW